MSATPNGRSSIPSPADFMKGMPFPWDNGPWNMAAQSMSWAKDPWSMGAADPFSEYVRDFWQRSFIFLDVLRKRGNQQAEITSHPVNSVLVFETELVLNGESLPRPVNYSLMRVIPPKGTTIEPQKRPIYVVDPRAGQGPGIGGFKRESEIGEAFKAGHPVYFASFAVKPVPGQTIEDVAHAHTHFLDHIVSLHPEANGKPFVLGNCQAGWHVLMAGCMRPDAIGPVMVAGAPLSYWGGVHGKYPMRYLGGMLGGSWLSELTSDMSNGTFDGAWLISNFDAGNPTNTYWTKQYNVWSNPDKEHERYLGFENWWGDFITLRGEELLYMVDNLFIGNKFSTAQMVTQDGIRLDLREVKSPIICFCSKKDNITPVQQALDWIPDNYENVDEIRKSGQRIFYCIHETSGHLAIFVGSKIAAKEHAEFINIVDVIECMPPGLYEIMITPKKEGDSGNDLVAGDYNVRLESRSISDIKALGGNTLEDELKFATVARMSEVNKGLYRTFMQPWIKAMITPQLADLALKMHPLRISYAMFSDKNPFMQGVAQLAEQAQRHRVQPSPGNPFVQMQEQVSDNIKKTLDTYSDFRDQLTDRMFHAIYGLPAVQSYYGISAKNGEPRPRPGKSMWTELALQKHIDYFKSRVAEGGLLEASARAAIYITEGQRFVDGRSFQVVRKLISSYPDMSYDRIKSVLREQWAILAIDEKAALLALPEMLSKSGAKKRECLDKVRQVVTASGKLEGEASRRFETIERAMNGSLHLAQEESPKSISSDRARAS
ncbi:MAG: DUF3141 domain-containing protein [Hyphomicrobiaceae bacterium]